MERLKQILPPRLDSRRRDSVHAPKKTSPYDKALPSLPIPESRVKPETTTPKISTRISKPGLNLLDLPNEILLQITQHLQVHLLPPLQQNRFDGKERIIFVKRASNLINVSLTSKKLYPVAQEVLLHTVVLGGFDGLPSIASLVRFLLRRPEMGRHVKRLRLGLPPNKIHYFRDGKAKEEGRTSSMMFGRPPRDIENAVIVTMRASPLPENVKRIWGKELRMNYARPLCGVLVSLTPQLDMFSISHSLGTMDDEDMRRAMFGLGKADVGLDVGLNLSVLTGVEGSTLGRFDEQSRRTAKIEKVYERPREARGTRI